MVNVVTPADLGDEFEIGTKTPNKITIDPDKAMPSGKMKFLQRNALDKVVAATITENLAPISVTNLDGEEQFILDDPRIPATGVITLREMAARGPANAALYVPANHTAFLPNSDWIMPRNMWVVAVDVFANNSSASVPDAHQRFIYSVMDEAWLTRGGAITQVSLGAVTDAATEVAIDIGGTSFTAKSSISGAVVTGAAPSASPPMSLAVFESVGGMGYYEASTPSGLARIRVTAYV